MDILTFNFDSGITHVYLRSNCLYRVNLWDIYGISNFLKRHPGDINIHMCVCVCVCIKYSSFYKTCWCFYKTQGGWCSRICAGQQRLYSHYGICGPCLQQDFLLAQTSPSLFPHKNHFFPRHPFLLPYFCN